MFFFINLNQLSLATVLSYLCFTKRLSFSQDTNYVLIQVYSSSVNVCGSIVCFGNDAKCLHLYFIAIKPADAGSHFEVRNKKAYVLNDASDQCVSV